MGGKEETLQALAALWPDSRVVDLVPLAGGMSAEMWRARLDDGRSVVVRYPSAFVRTLFADAAAQEFAVLEAVCAAGLPAPRPLALGPAGPDRFLVMEFLPGRPTARPEDPEAFIQRAAEALARIHATPVDEGRFDFLLGTRTRLPVPDGELATDLREDDVMRALARIGEPPPEPDGLRHGDFWPGNLLWEDGQLTGIVDWENALRGPATADLAISRLDVRWILGQAAMEQFTAAYLQDRPSDPAVLAYWDLRAARRPMKNLPEWVAPYAALDRPDISAEHLQVVLLEFIDEALARI